MAIYVVPNVPLLPQDMKNACWWFCGKMMAEWGAKNGKAINDPKDVKPLPPLYIGNCGWAVSTCGTMATHLGLLALSRKDRTYNEMLTLVQKGPIWTSGMKTVGTDTFPHVVVIAGVADTGVLVHDPLPLKQGERAWRTWAWLTSFLALSDTTIDSNLLVVQ